MTDTGSRLLRPATAGTPTEAPTRRVTEQGGRRRVGATATALLVALLAGCGGGGGGDNASPAEAPVTAPVTPPVTPPVTVLEDPLFTYQWHLANTGQDTLSSIRPVAGIDLNLAGLHAAGVRGTGIHVSVIDTGLDMKHEDLQANIAPNGSFNFKNGSSDPTPATSDPDHGTSVAGVVGARGWNGVGGRGVAPEATLHGFNYLAAPNDANFLASVGATPLSNAMHVFNLSIGADLTDVAPVSANVIGALETLFASTRSGLGGLYIKSAGNGSVVWTRLIALRRLCRASVATTSTSTG